MLQVSIAVHCLSTDFSNQKGVKVCDISSTFSLLLYLVMGFQYSSRLKTSLGLLEKEMVKISNMLKLPLILKN